MSCGEYWPADIEFFDVKTSSRDGLTPRCIACIKAKVWQLYQPRGVAHGKRYDVTSHLGVGDFAYFGE